MSFSIRSALLVVLAIGIAMVTVSIISRQEPTALAHAPFGGAASENAGARAQWEMMRLRDPATGRIPEGMRERELAYAATMPTRNSRSGLYKAAGVADYTWRSVGPYNVGGRTRALALDITGEDTILAGGVSGGIWRSTDGGATWTKRTTAMQHQSVTCIVQDARPGRTNVWYYGTGEQYGNSATYPVGFYYGFGIYKSTDNGLTWDRLPSSGGTDPTAFTDPSQMIWSMAIDPSNPEQEEVYAAMYGIVRRTTDGGATWRTALSSRNLPNSPYAHALDVAVTGSGVVYATTSSDGERKGIWRSATGDPGSFKSITPPGWPSSYRRVEIGIAPSNENVVYFLGETPGRGLLGRNFHGDTSWQSLWKYTYISGDGTGDGGRWEDRTANLPAMGGSFGDLFSQGGYDLHVSVKPNDENVVFIGATNLYRSTDGFSTPNNVKWVGGYQNVPIDSMVLQNYSYPRHHPDQHALVFSRRDPNVVFTSSDGGVHKTLDCTADSIAWISLNNGYYTTQFFTIAVDGTTSGSDMVIGGMQDNGTWGTMSAGATGLWREIGSGDGAYCAVTAGGRELVVSKQQGKTYRVLLDDEGQTSASTRIDPSGAGDYLFINPFAVDPNDDRKLYLVAGRYLWRNADISAIPLGSNRLATVNWTKFEKTRTNDADLITAVGVSTAKPANRVYYGTLYGKILRLENAAEGEPDPIDVTPKLPKSQYAACIAVDPLDGDRAVAVFSNYNVPSLYLTTDAGETWTTVGGNLEPANNQGPSCRWFAFLHRPNGTLFFVATSTGLYSTNRLNGDSTVWALESPEMIGLSVIDMVVARQSDGRVVVGTHGGGAFAASVVSLGVDDEPGTTAGTLLEQSYPNPTRDLATIAFTVPAGGNGSITEITLFDDRGVAVRRLVNERLPAGRHARVVDTRALPAGAYRYRLRVNGRVEEKTLIVLR